MACVTAVALAGCGSSDFEVKGTLTLPFGDEGATDVGARCLGQGGYADIARGSQIVIKNDKGKRIAVGALGDGTIERQDAGWLCHFAYSIKSIPSDGDLYTIAIGNRDDYTFKKADASDLSLTLGN